MRRDQFAIAENIGEQHAIHQLARYGFAMRANGCAVSTSALTLVCCADKRPVE
jgi:hypothetical protein